MKSLAKSLIVYDPLRGFYINEIVFFKFFVMGRAKIDLYGIAHVKVEFIQVLKIYTIPILECACMCNSFSYDDLYSFFSLMIKWYQFKKLSAPRSSKKLVWWWYYDAVFPNRIRLMNLKFFTACLIHNSTPASDTLSSMFF